MHYGRCDSVTCHTKLASYRRDVEVSNDYAMSSVWASMQRITGDLPTSTQSCAFPIVIVMRVALRRIQDAPQTHKPEGSSKSVPTIPKIQLSFALALRTKPNPRAL
jgi:hypothetical protein